MERRNRYSVYEIIPEIYWDINKMATKNLTMANTGSKNNFIILNNKNSK